MSQIRNIVWEGGREREGGREKRGREGGRDEKRKEGEIWRDERREKGEGRGDIQDHTCTCASHTLHIIIECGHAQCTHTLTSMGRSSMKMV